MKTNFIRQASYLSHHRMNSGQNAFMRAGIMRPERMNESEQKDINTNRSTTRVNTSGPVCFKGIGNFANKIATSKKFNSAAAYVLNNEAMFQAITVLGLGMTVKPALTMIMPGAGKKDKTAIAAKNIVSAVISYALAALIMKPINTAVIKLTKNPAKYIKNDMDLINRLDPKTTVLKDKKFQDAFTAFWKNIPDCAISPIKATLCVLFTPVVINLLNSGKKKKEAEMAKIEKEISNMDNLSLNNNPAFEKVAKGGNN